MHYPNILGDIRPKTPNTETPPLLWARMPRCLSSSLAPLVCALSSLLSVGGGKKAVLKGFGVNPHGNLTGLYAKATGHAMP